MPYPTTVGLCPAGNPLGGRYANPTYWIAKFSQILEPLQNREVISLTFLGLRFHSAATLYHHYVIRDDNLLHVMPRSN
jgi:cytochrome b561